ncbi:MAG TPA: sugar phosphate isomerase/epimerase family protein [Chloroflexota bacterium]|nr:sugar phosphate isomerase/epimerase family protein [Chloroflexota bacterium]
MKLCYALRRGVFHPSQQDLFGTMPPRQHRSRYLALVRELGFPSVEVGVDENASAAEARDLSAELADAGLSIGCVRAGGSLGHPQSGPAASRRIECAIQYAQWVGAEIVNSALVSPATHPGGPGAGRQGEQVSQGASRTASEADFLSEAERLRHFGKMAADAGLRISIEVHQGSLADNSWATLHLLDLVGLESVGANPDLGNIYWQYEAPEETTEAAIVALAPRAVYWHCKNLRRVHIPELHRSFFQRVPLPDGDIDYRFAISAMLEAGYDGFLAVEGAQFGDQLSLDRRSLDYVKELLGA